MPWAEERAKQSEQENEEQREKDRKRMADERATRRRKNKGKKSGRGWQRGGQNEEDLGDQPRIATDGFAWICNICNKAKFRTFDEAVEHENTVQNMCS